MSGYGLHKATGRWNNPLKTIEGKKCKMCGKPATCAVLSLAIYPACEEHARGAEAKGYDVVFPEKKVKA